MRGQYFCLNPFESKYANPHRGGTPPRSQWTLSWILGNTQDYLIYPEIPWISPRTSLKYPAALYLKSMFPN